MINEPKKWEYRIFVQPTGALPHATPPGSVGELTGDLSEGFAILGLEGWQLASATPIGDDHALFAFKRPHEQQRRRRWALHYIKSPQITRYEETLEHSTTHLLCCPLDLCDQTIDLDSSQMQDWRQQHRLRHAAWRPSSRGMRAGSETQDQVEGGDPLWEIHRNGTVTFMRATVVLRDDPHDVNVAGLLYGIGSLLQMCKHLYAAMEYDGSAILRVRVTRCADLRFLMPSTAHPLSEPSLVDSPFALTGGLLQVDDELRAQELAEDPLPILRRLAKGIFHTLGVWNVALADQQLQDMLN